MLVNHSFSLSLQRICIRFAARNIRRRVFMERFIINKLKEWKDSPDRKPLILLGARQVGKTWMMNEFGRREYESVVYVNCDEEPFAKELFMADYNIPRILLTLEAYKNVKIKPGKTLIILDELQEAPRGLHCLKYFHENAPEYHVMVAGSLLGISLGHGESFPVGKVDMLRIYPMTFPEFLLAVGENGLLELLRQQNWEAINVLRLKYIELLRLYYYVGGMPEVVDEFARNKDLKQVRRKQQDILDAYRNDISKHTTKVESIRISQVLGALPSQLAKENKKFIYSQVRKGARAADFELAIQWLIDAGIVHKVSRVKEIMMPLKFYEDFNAFKLFMLDCGLLGCMANATAAQMLVTDNVFREFKGAFTEQYAMQQMVAGGIEPFYWSNDKTSAEIDFAIQWHDRAVPVEVKAEENVRAKSMATYISNNNGNLKGLRISMLGYVDQGWLENIPLYAVSTFLS